MTSPSSFIKSLTALALVLAAVACNEYPLHDVGYTSDDLSGSTDGPDEPIPPVAEFGDDFLGVWIGEAEDPLALQSNADNAPPVYRFPSGSPSIRLELIDRDFRHPTGTITFGDPTPPPAATDPNIAYPTPDPDFDFNLFWSTDASLRPPTEGFPHSLATGAFVGRDVLALGLDAVEEDEFRDEGRVYDGKLELSYFTTEVFTPWCELQTSETCPIDQGWSVDDTGSCFSGDQQTPIDCEKLALCGSRVCQCIVVDQVESCSGATELPSELTIRFSDEGLVGLFTKAIFLNERGFPQPLGTVRFHRETP
jgi:hypothetical protein